MYKYNCLNPIAKIGLDGFSDDYSMVENADDADIILVRSAKMHDMELPAALTAVARAGAGVNNIPLEKCAEKGIVVFNTPGANANGVKELVIFAMIASVRDIIGGIDWVKSESGNDDIAAKAEKEKKRFVGNEIYGKTLAVIGLGAIGVKVANACVDLGMKVKGYDAFLSEAAKANLSGAVTIADNMNEAVLDADFITLHIPALDATRGMVNAEFMSGLKDGTVIINAARDTLVNEDDMKAALESGKIRKYVCDFPTSGNSGLPNAIIIPHLGASTEESEDNCAVMAVEEIRDFMENGNIRNSVNYPPVNMGDIKTARLAVCHSSSCIPKSFEDMIREELTITDSATNIADDSAYTLYETDKPASDELVAKLSAVDGIYKARVIKK